MYTKAVFLLGLTSVVVTAATSGSYTIRSLIGSGSKGDGGPATSALLDGPYGLAQDQRGNIYISESNAGNIRQVRPDGTIATYAGTGILNDGVQGQAAKSTDLVSPGSLVVDKNGELIFADTGACRIRKVLSNGTIRDLVGTGRCALSSGGFPGGFGGGATSEGAPLEIDIGAVRGMVFDADGQLIFSDATSNVVRRLDADGIVRVIAGTGGTGFSGDGSTAVTATLNSPHGLAVDDDGKIYIADSINCRVRAIASDGTIKTVLNLGNCAGTSSNSPGYLNGLAYDSSNNSILIASAGQGQVFRLNLSSSSWVNFAGSGSSGAVDSASASQYPFDQPAELLISGSTVLVADNTAFRVLQVRSNNVTAFAGTWPQLSTYSFASSAPLLRPGGLCFRPDGSLITIDAGSGRILSFSQPDQLAVFAGVRSPTGYSSGDGGPAVLAQFSQPRRLACASDGSVYVTDGREIRKIDRQGNIQVAVGAVQIDNNVSSLQDPTGVVLTSSAIIFSEPSLNEVIRYDLNARTAKIIAGTGTANFGGDGGAATSATLNNPGDVALDSKGNLFIADRGNGRVRKVSNGVIQTVAGAYFGFSYSDISGKPATSVSLGTIQGLTVDTSDQLYISEPSRVSLIASDGNIYVIGGFREQNDAGKVSYVNGPMYGLDGLVTDKHGRLYISVDQTGQVKVALPPGDPGPLPTVTGAISATGFGGLTVAAPGSFIEIYGGNLATTARSWSSSDFTGAHAPTSLNGTSVAIAGQHAFVSYISPDQVNVQVPSTVPLGAQSITVSTAAGISSAHTININSAAPGLLAPSTFVIAGKQYLGALSPDATTWVLPSGAVSGVKSRPAHAGETIVLYGIGFGTVTPGVNAGQLVTETNHLDLPFQISFDNVPATVSYAGLVQGEVGLYQISVVVPSGVTGAAVPVSFTLGGIAGTQALYTAIAN